MSGDAVFEHEALLYDGDADFQAAVGAFIDDAARDGDAAVMVLSGRSAGLVGDVLAPDPDVLLVPQEVASRRPAVVVREIATLVGERRAAGLGRLRVVSEVFDPATPALWDPWARFEAAVNELFAPLDLWALCPYDVRHTPDPVLDEVTRTHPSIHTSGGRTASPGYQDTATFSRIPRTVRPDALPGGIPAWELIDPTPAEARQAAALLATQGLLGPREVDDLVLGVSETVTNGHLHGVAPVTVRGWLGEGRVVVSVHDHGGGPTHPLAGLVDMGDVRGGRGLWLCHLLCARVVHDHGGPGFTIYLTAERAAG